MFPFARTSMRFRIALNLHPYTFQTGHLAGRHAFFTALLKLNYTCS